MTVGERRGKWMWWSRWLWPLPRSRPLRGVGAWEELGVAESCATVDASELRARQISADLARSADPGVAPQQAGNRDRGEDRRAGCAEQAGVDAVDERLAGVGAGRSAGVDGDGKGGPAWSTSAAGAPGSFNLER